MERDLALSKSLGLGPSHERRRRGQRPISRNERRGGCWGSYRKNEEEGVDRAGNERMHKMYGRMKERSLGKREVEKVFFSELRSGEVLLLSVGQCCALSVLRASCSEARR